MGFNSAYKGLITMLKLSPRLRVCGSNLCRVVMLSWPRFLCFFLESVQLNTWKLGTRHHEINQNYQILGIFMFTVKHDTMTTRQAQEFVSGRYKTFTPHLFFLWTYHIRGIFHPAIHPSVHLFIHPSKIYSLLQLEKARRVQSNLHWTLRRRKYFCSHLGLESFIWVNTGILHTGNDIILCGSLLPR
jgi:hypothetical protein